MRTVRLTTMAAILLGACFTSCNKDNYTAAPATSNASSNLASGGTYTANNNNASEAITPGDATTPTTTTSYGWTWSTAEVYISGLSIKTVKDGDQAQAHTVILNRRYNILPNPSTLTIMPLTTGTYNRIEVAADVQNAATGAIVMQGVIGQNGSSLPATIMIEQPMQLVYKALNKVVGANEQYILVMKLDVNALNNILGQADAKNARLANGSVEISKRSNIELYNKVMQNIHSIVILDIIRR